MQKPFNAKQDFVVRLFFFHVVFHRLSLIKLQLENAPTCILFAIILISTWFHLIFFFTKRNNARLLVICILFQHEITILIDPLFLLLLFSLLHEYMWILFECFCVALKSQMLGDSVCCTIPRVNKPQSANGRQIFNACRIYFHWYSTKNMWHTWCG